MSRTVRMASSLAVAGAAHAAVNVTLLRRPQPYADALPRISILVPARDEAHRIDACVRALVAQDVAEILVLDDESSDGTAAVAEAAAAGDRRVRVVTGTPTPPGWLGKPHACAQLARLADASSEVLVFVDADVVLAPAAVRLAVGLLIRSGLDLVSPYPRQRAESMSERLIQPLLQWSWLTLLPLRVAEGTTIRALSAANGQFLIVRRGMYQRAGGHAAVRAEVLDDLALVRAVKDAGGRGGVVDGTAIATCRMYDGWTEVRDGYGKSLWAAFGSDLAAGATMAALGVVYVLPVVAALRGSRAGALGYAAGVAGRVVAARATGARTWPDPVAHPLSIALFGYLTGRSVVQHRRGALRWKGRAVT